MDGIVIKKISNSFDVYLSTGEVVNAKPRGLLKAKGIFVGDKVHILCQSNEFTIESVYTRKNLLIRPPLTNLEQLVIVISGVPKPDFYIVDKLILFCYVYDITPVLVVNKQDVYEDINEYVKKVYQPIMDVVFISAKTKQNIDKLKSILKNKLSALAGQSAVGKSAIINCLFKNMNVKEGELSKKISRGKNTTRHCEIFVNNEFLIADTAGFTALDETLLPIPYYELPLYYKDYLPYMSKCRYSDCKHISESACDCAVKSAVESGELDKQRYLRYKEIYKVLEQKWVKTHG